MCKFNRTKVRPATGSSPVVTEPLASGATYEGGAGYARDAKSELFLLAVANMVGEDTFYEQAGDRDERYATLVRAVAVADPDWTARLPRLAARRAPTCAPPRSSARSRPPGRCVAAGLPGAPARSSRRCCSARTSPARRWPTGRSTYGRADPEAGQARRRRRRRPPVHRVRRCSSTTPRRRASGSATSSTWSTRPRRAPWQGDLFRYALDRRHGRGRDAARRRCRCWPRTRALRAAAVDDPARARSTPSGSRAAGMTWEDALSLAGDRCRQGARCGPR